MALEERLGARLLIRTTRKLSITDTGRSYYERALKILEDVDDAEQLVANQNAAPRGSLRISAPMSFGTLHSGPAIARFMAQYPEVKIELELSDRYVDIVGEGYDMAVRIGQLSDSSLVARQIAPTQLVLCASPAYLKQHGTPQTPADLKHHECLPTWPQPPCGVALRRQRQSAHRSRHRAAARQQRRASRDAAIAGLGIAFLPTFIGRGSLAGQETQNPAGCLPAPSAGYLCRLSAAPPVLANGQGLQRVSAQHFRQSQFLLRSMKKGQCLSI